MATNQIVDQIGQEYTKDELDIPEFGPGDTVRVSLKVVEGTRERIQVFEGVVLRRRKSGVNENFTVRRIGAHGVGVERTLMLHSPRIEKIEITRRGIVHRATLYHLRVGSGKANRIKERKMPPVPKGTNRKPAVVAAPATATLIDGTVLPIVDAPSNVDATLATDISSTNQPVLADTTVTQTPETSGAINPVAAVAETPIVDTNTPEATAMAAAEGVTAAELKSEETGQPVEQLQAADRS